MAVPIITGNLEMKLYIYGQIIGFTYVLIKDDLPTPILPNSATIIKI